MITYTILYKGQNIGRQALDAETARRYELTEGIAIVKEEEKR